MLLVRMFSALCSLTESRSQINIEIMFWKYFARILAKPVITTVNRFVESDSFKHTD